MFDIVGVIKNVAGAISEYFGWARDRSKLNNTPEMQAAAEAQKEADAAAERRKHIVNRDENAAGNDIST